MKRFAKSSETSWEELGKLIHFQKLSIDFSLFSFRHWWSGEKRRIRGKEVGGEGEE